MTENFITAEQYNNSRKIIARYILNVHEDGGVSIEPLNEVSGDKSLPVSEMKTDIIAGNNADGKPSAKIQQILVTLNNVRDCMAGFSHNEMPLKTALNIALDKTAKSFGVTKQTCIDKLCRQLGKRMEDWPAMLEKWLLRQDSSEIKELLLSNIAHGNEINDIAAIQEFFLQNAE